MIRKFKVKDGTIDLNGVYSKLVIAHLIEIEFDYEAKMTYTGEAPYKLLESLEKSRDSEPNPGIIDKFDFPVISQELNDNYNVNMQFKMKNVKISISLFNLFKFLFN